MAAALASCSGDACGPDASGGTVQATREARSDESSRSSERETEDISKASDDSARFVSVSAGIAHICGVRADGSIACWGEY